MSSNGVKPKTKVACLSMSTIFPSLLILISNSKLTSFVPTARSVSVRVDGNFPRSKTQLWRCSLPTIDTVSGSTGLGGKLDDGISTLSFHFLKHERQTNGMYCGKQLVSPE